MSLRHAHSTLIKTVAGLALGGGLVAGFTAPAQAAGPLVSSAMTMQTAQQLVGTPYRYGGTSPAGFDCSGYTSYVFARLGVPLPRTADAQMRASVRISGAQARPGDLVFFTSGGRAYHAGIYAGNGYLYDSPHTGTTVGLRKIWTTSVVYGRVV